MCVLQRHMIHLLWRADTYIQILNNTDTTKRNTDSNIIGKQECKECENVCLVETLGTSSLGGAEGSDINGECRHAITLFSFSVILSDKFLSFFPHPRIQTQP